MSASMGEVKTDWPHLGMAECREGILCKCPGRCLLELGLMCYLPMFPCQMKPVHRGRQDISCGRLEGWGPQHTLPRYTANLEESAESSEVLEATSWDSHIQTSPRELESFLDRVQPSLPWEERMRD